MKIVPSTDRTVREVRRAQADLLDLRRTATPPVASRTCRSSTASIRRRRDSEKYFNRTQPQALNAQTLPPDFSVAARASASRQPAGAARELPPRRLPARNQGDRQALGKVLTQNVNFTVAASMKAYDGPATMTRLFTSCVLAVLSWMAGHRSAAAAARRSWRSPRDRRAARPIATRVSQPLNSTASCSDDRGTAAGRRGGLGRRRDERFCRFRPGRPVHVAQPAGGTVSASCPSSGLLPPAAASFRWRRPPPRDLQSRSTAVQDGSDQPPVLQAAWVSRPRQASSSTDDDAAGARRSGVAAAPSAAQRPEGHATRR